MLVLKSSQSLCYIGIIEKLLLFAYFAYMCGQQVLCLGLSRDYGSSSVPLQSTTVAL
jgi:hypothetical protein